MSQQARQEVSDMMSRFYYEWDSQNAASLKEFFARDASVKSYALGELVAQMSVDQLVSNANDQFEKFRESGIQTRHTLSNGVLRPDSDGNLVGRAYVTVFWQFKNESSPRLMFTVVLRNTFTETEAGWKISTHELHIDQQM